MGGAAVFVGDGSGELRSFSVGVVNGEELKMKGKHLETALTGFIW